MTRIISDAPEWLKEVDFDEIAAVLDEQLRELLGMSSLSGELGATLAQRLTVSKFDSVHEEGAWPHDQYFSGDDELARITAILSEQLKELLLKYGASREDVEFAVVRRWDMLAAAENHCTWSTVWSYTAGTFCSVKTCC